MTLLGVTAGCTSIGVHDELQREQIEFGAPIPLRVCLLRESGVSEERARLVMDAVARELAIYAIDVTVVWSRPWERPGFTGTPIMRDVLARPLEPPCDRLVALVGRHLGDALWGLALPEVLGAVEAATYTRGYVVIGLGSPNQLFASPTRTAVHEFYHLLGCGHGLSKSICYQQIAWLKKQWAPESDFFPSMTHEGEPIRWREQANALLRSRPTPPRQAAGQPRLSP